MTLDRTKEIKHGDRVKCLRGSIDSSYKKGAGKIGIVDGFAQFSSYHAREAFVKFENDEHGGWFWIGDVEKC